MEFTGKIKNVKFDWNHKKWQITFDMNECPEEEINVLNQCEKLTINVKKFRKRRSVDANALLWVCLGQIAAEIGADKWDVYLQMLKRYGRYTYICVKPSVVEAVKLQWRECEVIGELMINGQQSVQMLVYFGSSTYNTKEFSVLLDGVISEMRELGLQTPASEKMERALEQYEKTMVNIHR